MLLFVDRSTQEAFNKVITFEQNHWDALRIPERRNVLSQMLFEGLLVWPLPPGYMRAVQLYWHRQNVDDKGYASEFGWGERIIPVESDRTPLVIHEDMDWYHGMTGAFINHCTTYISQLGWDWSSHT